MRSSVERIGRVTQAAFRSEGELPCSPTGNAEVTSRPYHFRNAAGVPTGPIRVHRLSLRVLLLDLLLTTPLLLDLLLLDASWSASGKLQERCRTIVVLLLEIGSDPSWKGTHARCAFCLSGLLILLQMLLVNVKLVTPQPVCDRQFLDSFIRTAVDEDKVMNVPCVFPEDVIIPEPSINAEWRKLQISQQRDEVQQGLSLLMTAVPKVTKFISECKLELSLQKFSSKVRTLKNILDRVNVKTESEYPPREARTFPARTLQQFYGVYRNFLQGKYRTVIISICSRAQNR
ncbi:PREDICTED: erythropoietin [Nanorana parkeri]|uniref:erythropoietin n=1 Tax=Nanorana parkeri TaxID=125878 RepID=UPI0008540B8F|nr:PREDICTED: erythropoietin [Nanorana parkeri]